MIPENGEAPAGTEAHATQLEESIHNSTHSATAGPLEECADSIVTLLQRAGARAGTDHLVRLMQAEWPTLDRHTCLMYLFNATRAGLIASDDEGRSYRLTNVVPLPRAPKSRLKAAGDRRNRPELVWTVEDTLPEYGVGMLVGPSYTGKTYVGVDLSLSLCNDSVATWFGREVRRRGDVVYVLMEGAWDFQQRVEAWLSAHPGTTDERLYTLEEEELNLGRGSDVKQLALDVEALDLAPVLLVIDTQSLATAGIDENDNSRMSSVYGALKWLSKRLHCVVLAVHHTGHSGNRARGASAQFASADVELLLDSHTIKATKVKAYRPWEQPEGFRFVSAGRSAHIEPVGLLAALAGASGDRSTALRERVLTAIGGSPGLPVSRLRSAVGGSKDLLDDEIERLKSDGLVVEQRGRNGARTFHLAIDVGGDPPTSQRSPTSRQPLRENGP
jgi:hypothetical protein